ncbi:cache domain-containing protein [Sulfurovum sp. zt1-1]|uniref:Cache domain-containing protein n=1 Tax=Sulfurovum zhangzhouensis TaxID=3019067 RepID=A0ABT7QVY5_9BACT|nr:cache domain-containing protein [Sulfurovum zhangzhouensis]MDM5270901.1 cache domain-containing protein [Sulfurovum zhangzhouensis]
MKKIIIVLSTLVFLSSAWAAKPVEEPQTVGPEIMLGTATHYVDTIFTNASALLKLVASTPEAERGDWKGIKPYLGQISEKLPGVYSYILPNGDYYTLDRDFTNLNLSNRGYFKSLFTGNAVNSFPIFSRSTGKKSIFIAEPIIVNGKVTGALGISIFLDELNAKLNKDFDLPLDYTWYVLNAKGNTILDKESDFIFMNPLTQGSDSLRKAVTEALKNDSGKMQYQLDREKLAYYQKLSHLDWWMFFAKQEGEKTQTSPKLKLTLERFVPELQNQLNLIDASIAKQIEQSNVKVEKESEIRKLLSAVLDANPNVVDAAYADKKGILRYIEPRDYKNFEGSDISSQEHIIAMRKNPQPLFSSGFMSVEDFLSMVVARPLYDNKKQFIGSITVLIRPELFITPMINKSTVPEDYELWIMQTDGMIIYDQDKEEIGKMIFSDPMYEGYETLLKLGKNIVAAPEGEGSYIFLSPGLKEKAIKNVIWKTVKLHDREWRVILAYRPYE